MSDKIIENNQVSIIGEVVSGFTFSHEVFGEGFYMLDVSVRRLSDSCDVIPLMISVVKIGEELSAAALTRGLGAPVKRTDICKIGFHLQDIILFVLCIAGFALTLGSRWFS